MEIFQSKLFARTVAKLHKNEKKALDEEVRNLIGNPSLGQLKKGDLKEVYVHKYKFQTTQFLLAYRHKKETLDLIMLGTHENYYRDLTRYIKS